MSDRDETGSRSAGGLRLSTQGDDSLEIVRSFAAPRAQVFRAFTEPALIRGWMLGPGDTWTMPVCTVDLRPGGKTRYEWRSKAGEQMGVTGTFVEVDPPKRLVHDEVFDEDWTGGPTRIVTLFEEIEGGTRVRMTIRYASAASRDAVFASPMADGMETGYQKLDAVLGGAQPTSA